VGDELREEFTWREIPLTAEGNLELTLPHARDLQKLLLGISLEAEGTPGCAGVLALDLTGFSRPDWRIQGTESSKPNLTLDMDRIQFENYSPHDGETIFLRATVRNDGGRTAEDVAVRGLSGADRKAFSNFANFPEAKIRRLDPGQGETVRLRWDWWEGTGDQQVTVSVDPDNLIAESNEADNEASKTVRILEKPDLGWGLVRDSTAAHADFSRVTSVPADWVTDPAKAELGPVAPFREILRDSDRAVILDVPLCNFGETPSATTTLEFKYWQGSERVPFLVTQSVVLPPLAASLERTEPKGIPVLLAPGCARVEIKIDPDGGTDERTRANNSIEIIPPEGFWDGVPVLRERRTVPKALERFKK
jgi:hypothetical protein